MSSKRKAPEQAPATEKTTKTASSQPAEEKEPKTLNFDDDEVTVYTKWGSDPDALNGKSSDWEVKLVNTTNPATSVKTENVCVLYRVPYNLQWKKPQIQEAVQKVAYGGNVSPVSTAFEPQTASPPARNSRAIACPSVRRRSPRSTPSAPPPSPLKQCVPFSRSCALTGHQRRMNQ